MTRDEFPPLFGSAPKPQQQEQKVEYQEQPEAEPQRDPVEDPDTLHSASYARVVEAISEGEIEGLVDRNGNLIEDPDKYGQAIFLDDTPLQSTDGKYNFRGVQVGMTFGTADQSVIVGFGKAADTIYSGQELKKGFPVSIGITNPDAEMVEVAVRFQSMLQQDKTTGDIHGSTVTYEVRCQLNGGAFVTLQTVTVKGKTRAPYLKTTSHRLPRSEEMTGDAWVIRVVRLTDEANSLDVANGTSVDFITVQTRNRFRYPYTALVATEIAARGFSGIPIRAYRIKGIRIRVPNNYFPESREYNRDPLTGDPVIDGEGNPVEQDWNGGFYVAWTSNPAWIFFDLCTNTRYGLGQQMGVTPDRPDGNVDKWSLYPVARYCDEPVKDGFGGMEPRFACSIYLQAREDAFKVLLDFCSVFRGTPYWQGGAISVTQDRPREVFRDFTNANVIEGVFTYSGTARKARHTVAIVRYSDPDNQFRPAFEYVSDPVGLAKYGVREVNVAGFACCSRGQAHRLGQWILQTELYATEMCTHKAGLEGAIMRPGDVYRVLDNNRAGVPQGGRLKAVAGDRLSVTLDRPIAIPAGTVRVSMGRPQAFAIAAQLTSSAQLGLLRTPQVVELVTTTGPTTSTDALTFATEIPAEVEPGAVFVVRTPAIEAQLFSLINIEESGPNEYQLTGLKYLPTKFGAIEEGLELEIPDITDLPENPADVMPPMNVTIARNAVVTPEGVSLRLVVSWEAPPSPMVDSYTVEKRLGSDNWELVEHTKATHSDFQYTVAGTYQVKVTARSTFGGLSDGIIAELVVPNTNPIELYSVTGLELVGLGNSTEFTGVDARFQWRINSPAVATEPGQEDLTGSTAGGDDPYFRDFVFEVWDVVRGLLLYTESTVNTSLVFSYSKNSESPYGPHNQFRAEVRGRDKYGNTTQPAVLVVENPPPRPPEALSVESIWRVAMLTWINPTDTDFAGTEVFASTTPSFTDAVLLSTTPGTSFQHTGMPLGQKTWYWVRAKDTFGNRSAREPLGEGISIVPGSLPLTDIDDFGIDETKIFREVIVLRGAVWTHHHPTVDAISWNAHKVIFRGKLYDIAAGSTALKYVWWRGPWIGGDGETEVAPGETVYRTSDVHPKDSGEMDRQNDFIVATNADNLGVYDLAWRGFANAVIGSAYIASISANKLVAGTIGAELIRLAAGGRIESQDFEAGVAGWGIAGNGSAEFNDVTIRGNLSTTSGYFNPAYPTRIFQARPSMVLPIEQWNSSYNGGATGTKNSNSFVGTGGFTTRRVLPYYGQLTVAPWITEANGAAYSIPSPAVAPLFFGVNVPDYIFPHPTTTDELSYFARPRRLAVAGDNVFTITAVVKCDSGFSVWYQIADAPVWMIGSDMRAMGNTYGPLADPLNVGGTWNLAAEIQDAAATSGYQVLTMNTRVKIAVAADKCILFAIVPMYGDASRPANDRYKLLNGYLEVTAENVGNILVTEDPGDTVPEEA